MNFIVGRGRSGTKLFSSLLNCHPSYSVAPESFFLLHLHEVFLDKNFDVKNKLKFLHFLKEDVRLKTWELDWTILKKTFLETEISDVKQAISFVHRFYGSHVLRKNHVEFFIDKNPHHTFYIPTLLKVYPKAKFIALVRDPIHNVNSYLDVPFDSNNVGVLSVEWTLFNREILKYKKVFKERILIVYYEDLIKDSVAVLNRVAYFFETSLFDDITFSGRRTTSLSWHKNVNQKIGKYGALTLSSPEIMCVNRLTNSLANEFDYCEKGHFSRTSSTPMVRFIGTLRVLLVRYFYATPFFMRRLILRRWRKSLFV